ncbi:MAG: DUF3794 domain-containing protein [Clostridia bacterium]|nr:DUF3794 domain-containing protein [Clostridia bacterium]
MQTEKEYLTGREIVALRCESTGDYSLPDYNTDVKKILAVKTKVFPSGKFASDDSLEFSGSVGYEVVYLDADNDVTHAEFSTDYDAALRINSENYVDSDVVTTISSCNIRLVGPRKLSAKCSLESTVRLCERRRYEVEGDAFVGYEPEMMTKTVSVLAPAFASGEGKEYTEEILSLEGSIADEVEILLTDASFVLDSLERSDDEVDIKGRVIVTLLYKNGDSLPESVTKEFPFDEDVDIDGVMSFKDVDARVEITSLKARVEPTDDGTSLIVSFTALPRIYAVGNSELEVVLDSYLKERGVENEHSEFGYSEHICMERGEETFSAKVSLEELGVESISKIIWAEALARAESCEIEENRVKISGEIRFSAIACQVSEENGSICFPIKFNVPFEQYVNTSCQIHENMRANCAVNATDAKIEFDENNVYASCELSAFVNLTSERRQRCLGASYATDEEFARDDSVVTVYYPDASESLFGIAKRFHTSVVSIAKANKLTESVFAFSSEPLSALGVGKLIIK